MTVQFGGHYMLYLNAHNPTTKPEEIKKRYAFAADIMKQVADEFSGANLLKEALNPEFKVPKSASDVKMLAGDITGLFQKKEPKKEATIEFDVDHFASGGFDTADLISMVCPDTKDQRLEEIIKDRLKTAAAELIGFIPTDVVLYRQHLPKITNKEDFEKAKSLTVLSGFPADYDCHKRVSL